MDQSMEESRRQLEAINNAFGSSESDDMAGKIAMAKQLSQMLSEKETKQSVPQIRSSGNRQVDILTASLPYMGMSLQKPMSLLVNIMNLQTILSRETIQMQSLPPQDGTSKGKQIVKAILPYLDPKDQNMINTTMRMMEMGKIMNVVGGDNNNGL